MRIVRALLPALLFAIWCLTSAGPAAALQPLSVTPDDEAIDLLGAIERPMGQADRIQVATFPGADGIVRRIEVRAQESGDGKQWAVFALKNDGDEQIDRLLVSPHFRLVGSGALWPDLGDERLRNVTASQGFKPERQGSDDADVFLLTIDPGGRPPSSGPFSMLVHDGR